MKRVKLILAVTLIAYPFLPLSASCLDNSLVPGTTTVRLPLIGTLQPPYFYYRSSDYNFAVLIPASALSRELQRMRESGSKDAADLATAIKADLPLTKNVDLFRYVLTDYYRFSDVQRLVVTLLSTGRVGIFDAQTGQMLHTVVMTLDNAADGRGRTFVGPHNETLFQTVDCIY